ncbi:MAG TPA: hypothetical protein VI408_04025 [Gaiellaceae bacterium]
MSEDRDRLIKQNDETEQDDVEAHKLKAPGATDEPGMDDDDVDAHVLKRDA